ncbi:MAG: DUF6259 domain-containing protein [Kiritimatiellia bacterium]|jgi:hypothetical protein
MKTLTLKTTSLDLAFSAENGALVGLAAPATGWTIHRRPELGLSWRLLVPIHDSLRNNPVFGEKQPVSSCESGPGFVRFAWDGVVSERAGQLPIRVTVEVRAEGAQAVWYTRIENRSGYTVESVYSPYIGDLSHPADAKPFRAFLMNYCAAQESCLWPRFEGNQGDHGVDYPTIVHGGNTPSTPFYLLRTDDQGLYVGVKAHTGESVAYISELRPGFDSAIHARVPAKDEIAGKPVHTLFAAVHSCYLQPGDSEDLTPIALEAYQGGWQDGLDIYRAWRDTWSSDATPPDWAREPHSWLQLHINSPEDELRLRFTELPKVAEECVRYGVKAIQLVGWNDGGQDQGNPSHSPDPRLGTHDELKQAIAECQAMGVKIILFSKFTWADRAEPWFREELHQYAVTDPYGDTSWFGGYRYFTPAQLLDQNTKRFSTMCFGSAEYREICKREFRKVAGLGCAGFLYDECQHHGFTMLCFNRAHGHKYGWPVYQNDNLLVRMFRDETPGLRKDFLLAGEACHDWEFGDYHLAYFRSRDPYHKPVQRYLRPHAQIMTAISGFDDRDMVVQCLLYRYIISYEPYNFHGWLHDFPDTVAFGRKMDAFRTGLRRWLWDGEFRDTCGARVADAGGAPHHPFSHFVAKDETHALVIGNYTDNPVSVRASLDNGAPLARYRAIEDDGWTPIPADGLLPVPPHTAIVVLQPE